MTWTVFAREAELSAMPLWIGTDAADLGEWALRTVPHAPGLKLRRTNSCLAVGAPGLAFADAVDAVPTFDAEVGREALAQVEVDSEVERAFVGLGWRPVPAEVAPFQVAPVSLALPRRESPK